mgnify:FL=1
MSEDKQALRIRYEYEQDSDVRLQYAHGVWGGINPHGEVELNFYTESDKLPPYSERIVAPDGNLGHETAPYDENLKVISRRIHTKLILNYHTVKAVIEWLQEKAEALEAEEGEGFYFDDENGFRQ